MDNSKKILILFKSYSEYYIQDNNFCDRRLMMIRSSHSGLCSSAYVYDNCMKITYDVDTKEFSYRENDSLLLKKLKQPKLEKFLLKAIKKHIEETDFDTIFNKYYI